MPNKLRAGDRAKLSLVQMPSRPLLLAVDVSEVLSSDKLDENDQAGRYALQTVQCCYNPDLRSNRHSKFV